MSEVSPFRDLVAEVRQGNEAAATQELLAQFDMHLSPDERLLVQHQCDGVGRNELAEQ